MKVCLRFRESRLSLFQAGKGLFEAGTGINIAKADDDRSFLHNHPHRKATPSREH